MYKDIIEDIKPELDKAVDFLKGELAKMRTGRVSPSLVEEVQVDCFGEEMSLKQLAAINSEGPRQLVIEPWDDSYIEPIEKALQKEDLGASPAVQNEVIRMSFPSMSKNKREKLKNEIGEKKENARQTIRKWRDEVWKEIQNEEQEGEISEDNKYRAKDELQDLVDEYNEKIDEIVEEKKEKIEE